MSKSIRKLLLTTAIVAGVTSIHFQTRAVDASGQATAGISTQTVGANKTLMAVLVPVYNIARENYEKLTGKESSFPKDASTMGPTVLIKSLTQILKDIGEIKCARSGDLPKSTEKSAEKRDFQAEYDALTMELFKASKATDQERLNLQLAKLEKEAAKAGVLLGEAAEKKSQESKTSDMAEQKKQAWQAIKKAEEDKDSQAYATRETWQKSLVGTQPLVDLLKLDDRALFGKYENASQNAKIKGMMGEENNENVLRAHRHKARVFLAEAESKKRTGKQITELNGIITAVDTRLGNMGIKATPQVAQGMGITAEPGDEAAYQTFQYIWNKSQKTQSGTLYQYISKLKNTDSLVRLISFSQSELSSASFDPRMLRTISFSKATIMELKAFRYALSKVSMPSFSKTEINELTKSITDQLTALINNRGISFDVKERAKDELTMAQDQPRPAAPPPPPGGMGGPPPPPSGSSLSSSQTLAMPARPLAPGKGKKDFRDELLEKRKRLD